MARYVTQAAEIVWGERLGLRHSESKANADAKASMITSIWAILIAHWGSETEQVDATVAE